MQNLKLVFTLTDYLLTLIIWTLVKYPQILLWPNKIQTHILFLSIHNIDDISSSQATILCCKFPAFSWPLITDTVTLASAEKQWCISINSHLNKFLFSLHLNTYFPHWPSKITPNINFLVMTLRSPSEAHSEYWQTSPDTLPYIISMAFYYRFCSQTVKKKTRHIYICFPSKIYIFF